MGHVGSSKDAKYSKNVKADLMDVDDEDFNDHFDDDDDFPSNGVLRGLGEESLRNFCKKASMLFFEEYGLISHQINSFNQFISTGVQSAFDFFGDLTVEPGYDPSKKGDGDYRYATVKFGKVTLDQPTFWGGGDGNSREFRMLPRHARLQRMTYSSKMKVDVQIQVYIPKMMRSDKFKTGKEQYLDREILKEESKETMVGRLPIMVKSDLCWMKGVENVDCDFDHGGYFLIKGAEKTFIAQEHIYLKRLWIIDNPWWSIGYKSQVKRHRLIVKLVGNSRIEEINSGEKVLTVYFLGVEIPIWMLFFAFGVSSDREVVELIDYADGDARVENILFASIHDADDKYGGFRKGKNALNFIDKSIKGVQFPPPEPIEECLNLYIFPNIKGLKRKARFLAYMVKGLLMAYTGRRKCDNRDDFRNKRLELSAELLERELKVHIAHARKRLSKALQRDLYVDRDVRPIDYYLDASIITNGLQRAFSTGAWCHPYKRLERISGVVANVGRTNPLQTMAELRRTRQQVQYTGKVGDARYPHPSHWGKVCFLSTPDGENCGLVKNLAVTGLVSTNISESILPQLFDCGMEELPDDTCTDLGEKDKVFLNGDWVGVCTNSISFVQELRSKRRRNELPHQVEIKRDKSLKEVRIYSDAGRILRPLLVVDNLYKIKESKGSKWENYSFRSLLENGVIELVGPEEEEDCCTAWGVRYLFGKKVYTHCELDMSFLLGLSCSLVPFANHDHARRVLYQSQKHSSQAIGFGTTNPNIRVDTLSHQLYYPQKPLFRTMTSDCLGKKGHPLSHNSINPKAEFYNGHNAIVAVNVHMGYNQEDSLVMNRASLQRGMFRSEHIRSYKAEIDNKDSTDKKRKPEDIINFGKVQSKIGRVDSLDDDGFPYVSANLQSGDIVIGRCAESGTDHSIKLKHTERGYVQKVVLSSNDEGKNFAVVSLRQVRTPVLGDKFSSMHGQKGVLGFLESQENFPFTRQGIVPDIVINPHAFPSRQTPGQLLEAALGKGIACGGTLMHATPFSTPSVDDITDQLHRAGFSKCGYERVYNGRTGEMVRSLIFMGPTFYQRLHHMSEDKVKFRNTGPVHPLTRQPVADRKRFGGVKFGEMERDCLIAHGASANLHERLFTLSDCSQIHICSKCKNVANVILRPVSGGRKIRGPYCRICECVDDIIVANVPYGAKLLCQELFSMGISLKFETQPC